MKTLFQPTIFKKMSAGFLVILLLLVAMGGTSVSHLTATGEKAREIKDVYFPSVQYMGQIKTALTNIERLALRYVLAQSESERTELEAQINTNVQEIQSDQQAYQAYIDTPQEQSMYDTLLSAEQKMGEAMSAMTQAAKANDYKTVEAKASELKAPFQTAMDVVEKQIVTNTTEANAALTDSIMIYESGKKTDDLLTITGLIAAALLAWFMTRMITKPVSRLKAAALRISSGDLTSEDLNFRRRDELGQLADSFNRMAANLRSVLAIAGHSAEQAAASAQELAANTEHIRIATGQIAAAMDQVAEGSEKQSRCIGESNLSFQEMANGMRHIAAHVEGVNESITHTSALAETGNQTVQSTVDQMNAIQEKVTGLAHSVKGLGERSKSIGQIVEVITTIAKNTNLLSLNAAIEAARVGESGSGFAVVAHEIRKLAEQSAKSAEEIASLIRSIQTETQEAVELMEAGSQEVSQGIKAVHLAGDSFRQIRSSVLGVADQIQEVSAATQQVSAGTEQVAHSFTIIAEIAEQATQSEEEVAASVQEQLAAMNEIASFSSKLAETSAALQETIRQFKV